MKNNKVFIKITNQQIYAEIQGIKELLETTIKQNNEQHACMESDCKERSISLKGQISLVKWLALGGIGIASTAAGWLIAHLLK